MGEGEIRIMPNRAALKMPPEHPPQKQKITPEKRNTNTYILQQETAEQIRNVLKVEIDDQPRRPAPSWHAVALVVGQRSAAAATRNSSAAPSPCFPCEVLSPAS